MRYVKWTFLSLIAILLFAFFHYTLPQHDIVRITNTYSQRIDVGENSIFWSQNDQGMDPNVTSRDVKFIETIRRNGKPMVYRNEDTGWVWPPYFKFDSFDVQAEAADLKSTSATPQWVVITHYGWRNQLFTIFPNAISIRPVASADVTIIPWVNIIILTLLLLAVLMIRRMWLQFRERMVDPVVAEAGDVMEGIDARADAARAEVRTFWGRLRAWFGTWRKKPRP